MKAGQEDIFFSVIIVNYNRSNDLSQVLISLSQQTLTCFEIIMVDNASTDDSLIMIEQDYPGVKVIRLEENCGVSGFNKGVNSAHGNYSVLLDNDVILSPNFIEQLYETIKFHPDTSVFALNIIDHHGIRQKDYLPQDTSIPILWHNFIGGGVVFLTADYKELGGYDTHYFIYINETELSARILLAGKKILYCPHIKVVHKTSTVARIPEISYFYFIRNSILFMKTYFTFFRRIDLLTGFLMINFKSALANKMLKIYIKAIVRAVQEVPSNQPEKKLDAGLARRFSNFWQGNPSMTHIVRRKIWGKRFK